MRLDRAVPHRLRIELGGALPPATHPFWNDTPPAEIARRREHVRITVDGTEVFAGHGPQFDPVHAAPEIGGGAPLEKFSGKILAQRLVRAAARGP